MGWGMYVLHFVLLTGGAIWGAVAPVGLLCGFLSTVVYLLLLV
jgi:hypothetical protein